ncbi:hypothetical protein CRG95_18410 [Escherichia sp. E4208]|nr:hypothetical protein D9740_11340 [Escherichia sp. E14V5]RZN02490.1 hypothetical protein D9741_15475 [Escherichia sp. E14V7]RZN29296.1 hypothetical protein D9739_03820 [Escherichia sp. E14V10]RZN50912.1 hypothetical protein D9597_06910 [Escherichia sp. E13S3]TGB76014.1 hypothetical protein CRI67_10530 [Escherichia sp. E4702]TGB82344.1 hypothetical protein CRG95_18410 [Escherichia sp. E4208]TLJ01986.1 hypothetical protein FEK41_00265 [Escherichia sp. E4694]
MDKVILPTGFLPMHTVKQIEAAKPKEKLRRLPIALFILACRKLAEVSNANVMDAAVQVFRIHVKTPSTGSAYISLPVTSARPVRSRRPW